MKSRAGHKDHPAVNVRGAFIRRTDFSNTDLRQADLSQADASGALFRNADFQGARLVGTVLRGADLTGATNLTLEQLAVSIIDDRTQLPTYIDRNKLRAVTKTHQELSGVNS